MPLNIVITMAGRGARFYEAGYTLPKYEIMAHGKSLFDWSMLSLLNFLCLDCRVIFVCLKENDSVKYIKKRTQVLGIENVHIIELDDITNGQATSAYLTRDLWSPMEPLMIYNIDTYVNPRSLRPDLIRNNSQGWVPCFQAPGEHWSFVRLGVDHWAIDIAEKSRISNYASIGLYWFSSAEYFIHAYDKYFVYQANEVFGERFIAPIYRHLISEGCNISISELPFDDVHVLGTPAELNSFLQLNPDQLFLR